MGNWKEKVAFLEASKSIDKKINDETVTFYEISAGKIFDLKNLAGPIGRLIDAMQKNQNSIASKTSRYGAGGDEPAGEIIELKAIEPKLEEQQALRRQRAITELIDTLTDDKNVRVLGEIIMDSMKDIFPRGSADNPPGSEFIKSVSLPALGQLISGVIEANKGVFGPLGGKIVSQIESKLDETLAERGVAEVAGTITPANPSETRGSTSPTPSNGSPQEDTTPAGS
jgi:hypothetical protein